MMAPVTDAEVQEFAHLGGFSFREDGSLEWRGGDEPAGDFEAMAYALVSAYFNEGPTAFAELVEEHRPQLSVACSLSENLKQVVLIGLRMGIDAGDGACAVELGALYYTGDIVEQDYTKAAELYEIAANAGSEQAMINLGYIYEHGRTGEADPAKAYQYYSFAAAAYGSSEALYKMGDLFSCGKGVMRSEKAAITLWQRAFDSAVDPENKGQAALRIAKVLVDEAKCAELGIEFDPLMALQLFQTAEVGLLISLRNGLTYYAKRLQEALEGQQTARSLLAGEKSF